MTKKKQTIFMEGFECKECSVCGKIAPLTNFAVKGKYKNGETKYTSNCKECNSKYYEENKEEISKQKKLYRNEHKEEIDEKAKVYYEENKEEIAKKNKIYRNENKEEIADRMKIYQIEHKEELGDKNKIYRNEHKEELGEKAKIRYEENKDVILEKAKVYRNENRNEINARTREDRKLNPEKWKIRDGKKSHTRRGLGNDCINKPFYGGHFHHLGTTPDGNHDKDTTVCIPDEVHDNGHSHSIYAPATGKHGKNMIKKNTEMFLWLIENHPEDIDNIEYLYDVMSATIQRTLDGWENANGWSEWLEYKESMISEIEVDERESLDYWF